MAAKQLRTGDYADVMPDMSDEEYAALKRSIDEDGLKHPIEVAPDGTIVDGHHRYRACRELGIDPTTVTVDTPSVEQAIRANLTRRNLAAGEKREVVRTYLEENYDGERTQAEIASALGVSEGTVSNAWKELNPEDFTREEKRQQARSYHDTHPEASNREIARQIEADVSHPTIGTWREEWADGEQDADEPGDEPDRGSSEGADDREHEADGGALVALDGPSHDVSGPDDTDSPDTTTTEMEPDGADEHDPSAGLSQSDDAEAEAFDDVDQLVGDVEPATPAEPAIDVDRIRSGVVTATRALDDALDTLPDNEPTVRPEVARAKAELEGVQEVLADAE